VVRQQGSVCWTDSFRVPATISQTIGSGLTPPSDIVYDQAVDILKSYLLDRSAGMVARASGQRCCWSHRET